MKKYIISVILGTAIAVPAMDAENIVIMHTNDTHSQIDPTPAGTGGVARRKVLIDSIRSAEPHTLLIDAGDAVQGTVYFNLYGGEVEGKAMNALGYDFAILGNHEFDNGVQALADNIARIDAQYLSTNYDLSDTPLDTLIAPYRIVDIAGKRLGLIGLNLEPAGIIDPLKSEGVKYLDVYTAANSTAWHLKHNEHVDYVIAITHIGYKYDDMPDDLKLIKQSANIDAVIGAHSHTVIKPGAAEGIRYDSERNPVTVTQTGYQGNNLGVLKINTDNGQITADLIPVDHRLDRRIDPEITALLAPYRHGVDSLRSIVVGRSRIECDRRGEELANFIADFVADRGRRLTDGAVDLAIINRGGIRNGIAKGNVTKGAIMEMLPFANSVQVIELSGKDLLEALEINAEMRRVTFSNEVMVTLDSDGHEVVAATINGLPIDPDNTYRVATIDYLATGGDYMTPLTRGRLISKSDNIMWEDMLDYIASLKRKTITASAKPRMITDRELKAGN